MITHVLCNEVMKCFTSQTVKNTYGVTYGSIEQWFQTPGLGASSSLHTSNIRPGTKCQKHINIFDFIDVFNSYLNFIYCWSIGKNCHCSQDSDHVIDRLHQTPPTVTEFLLHTLNLSLVTLKVLHFPQCVCICVC